MSDKMREALEWLADEMRSELTDDGASLPQWLVKSWLTRCTKALAEQPAQGEALCRSDGRCQYAIDHGAEGLGHCPKGRCAMPVAHGEAVGRFEHGMTRALNAGDWPPSSQAIIADLINRRAARPADPPAPAVPDDAAKLRELLRRYRTEVPLGHQPHMIADEVDAILAAAPEITK